MAFRVNHGVNANTSVKGERFRMIFIFGLLTGPPIFHTPYLGQTERFEGLASVTKAALPREPVRVLNLRYREPPGFPEFPRPKSPFTINA